MWVGGMGDGGSLLSNNGPSVSVEQDLYPLCVCLCVNMSLSVLMMGQDVNKRIWLELVKD